MWRNVRTIAVMASVVIVAMTSQASVSGQERRGTEAWLDVLLPADAQLYLEDVLQRRSTAQGYQIRTPPLEPGEDYFYSLRAELNQGDRRVTLRRRVPLRAGKTTAIDLSSLDSFLADQPARGGESGFPKGPPPQAGQARWVDGKLQLVTTHYKPIAMEKMKKGTDRNGKPITYKFLETQWVSEQQTRELDGQELQARDVAGNSVDSRQLASRLAQSQPVLFSTDGAVDSRYLRPYYKDDSLVLLLAAPRVPVAPPTPKTPGGGRAAREFDGALASVERRAIPRGVPERLLAWGGPGSSGGQTLEPARAVVTADGKLTLTQLQPPGPPSVETIQVDVDGTPTTFALLRSSAQLVRSTVNPKTVKAFGSDGGRLDADQWPRLLERETDVLTTVDEKLLDPNQLQLLKDGVIVLIVPWSSLPVPAMAAPGMVIPAPPQGEPIAPRSRVPAPVQPPAAPGGQPELQLKVPPAVPVPAPVPGAAPRAAPPPLAPPVQVRFVAGVDKENGRILFEETAVTKEQRKQGDRDIWVTVPFVLKSAFQLKDGKVTTGDGKSLKDGELWKRLEPGTRVVVLAPYLDDPPREAGAKAPIGVRALFKDDTVILVGTVVPEAQAQGKNQKNPQDVSAP